MMWEKAKEFVNQYIDNDCYTEKCQTAHRMAVSAIRKQLSCELVETTAEPYQGVAVSANVPAVILAVKNQSFR